MARAARQAGQRAVNRRSVVFNSPDPSVVLFGTVRFRLCRSPLPAVESQATRQIHGGGRTAVVLNALSGHHDPPYEDVHEEPTHENKAVVSARM